jgi:hypothetical protein
MNRDLEIFTGAINHLVFLTTKDEYGTVRSRGIETYDHFAQELNEIGIVPKSGQWNENSLKCFFHRVKNRYSFEHLSEQCDFDFLGRSAWEYQSYTKREEVMDGISKKPRLDEDKEKTRSTPVFTYNQYGIENWKNSEIDQVRNEDKEIIKKYKKLK